MACSPDSQPSWMFDPCLPPTPDSAAPSRRSRRLVSPPPPPRMGLGRDPRSLNKMLRPILESSGMEYGPDATGAELEARMLRAGQIADKGVGQIVEDIQKARRASLCFVVDVTGSMTKHVAGVHKYIRHIVETLLGAPSSPATACSPDFTKMGPQRTGGVGQRRRGYGCRGTGGSPNRGDCHSAPSNVEGAQQIRKSPLLPDPILYQSSSSNFRQKSTLETLELAFVGYRDIGDEELGKYPVLEFTEDVGEFLKFMERSVKAVGRGGGDFCEHALWGLKRALDLRWKEGSGTRIIFHIADQPCHGQRFHDYRRGNQKADRFPNGVPGETPAEVIFAQFQNNGIQYNFGKITNNTDKMIRVFSELYGDAIPTHDVGNPENIRKAVVDTVQSSVDTNVAATKAGKRSAVPRVFQIVREEPRWDQLDGLDAQALVYELPSRENFNNGLNKIIEGTRLERNNKRVGTIKVAPHPFAAGSERIAYYGCHYGNASEATKRGVKVVLKEYRYLGKGHNSAFRYEQANEIQTVASFLAMEFNQYLRRTNTRKTFPQNVPLLKFLKVKTVSLTQPGIPGPGPGAAAKPRFMCYENFLRNTTKFVRFTNNVSYAVSAARALEAGIPPECVDLVMAFSHWTYRITNGFLMVVDLEGCLSPPPPTPPQDDPLDVGGTSSNLHKLNLARNNGANAGDSQAPRTLLLTDPAIHCMEMVRYAPMNLGRIGMQLFMENHDCNKFCEGLFD